MPTTIDQYREAKATYQKLHNQAKKELLARFHELASELLQIQKELKEDFATKVAIPSKPKMARRTKNAASPKKATELPPKGNVVPNPQIARTEKKLTTAKQKLQEAVASGKDSKPIKDRIYELEDELRLAKEK
jgi:hypothetical protein